MPGQQMYSMEKSKLYRKDKGDSNMKFLNIMNGHKTQMELISIRQIQKKVNKITKKLYQIDQDQVQQWKNIQICKIRQTYQKYKQWRQRSMDPQNDSQVRSKLKIIKQHLRVVVYVCHELKVLYDAQQIQSIIKYIYYQQYKDDALEVFQQAGYNIQELKVLQYSESDFSWFCWCCSE